MAKTRKIGQDTAKAKKAKRAASAGKKAPVAHLPQVATAPGKNRQKDREPNIQNILDDLNPAQKQAVTYTEGPLLIIAGAGTGKTRVITSRIAYLIASKIARAEEILALTFTEKAAQEMEERVDTLVPYGFADTWIGTFHAFGDRLLRDWSIELGLTSNFRVLTQAEQLIFLKEHLFDLPLKRYLPLGNPTKHLRAILTLISRAKDEDISPEEYLTFAEKLAVDLNKACQSGSLDDDALAEAKDRAEQQKELALVYEKYQELMAKNGLIDFGDQIRLILNLLRTRPNVLAELQKKFHYILVDEFQDTNYSQFQLVKLLAAKQRNLTVVGDDDQCLPGGTMITVPSGRVPIEELEVGDVVITAVGKGAVSVSKIKHIFKRVKKTIFLTIKTSLGYKVRLTANHKMFCCVPQITRNKNNHYVYLMWRKNLGWRIGRTNDLASRLRLERSADLIVGLRSFHTEKEAGFHEVYWGAKYGIPSVCFNPRPGVLLTGVELEQLYRFLDTEKAARRLARDLGVDLDAHHFCLGGMTRGTKKRLKVNLQICVRKYSAKKYHGRILKNPTIVHCVNLETSCLETIKKLKKAGYPVSRAKKGYRVRKEFPDLVEAGNFAKRILDISQGLFEAYAYFGRDNIQHLPALVMPAGNVLLGHYLPVYHEGQIIYDEIVDIVREEGQEGVYDLEIDRTHNYLAENIVVHNSIYKWRGAAISNIIGFKEIYPEAKEIVINENYRSTQEILDISYRLIRFNDPERLEVKNKINKKLVAKSPVADKKNSVQLHLFDAISSEADKIASIIEENYRSGKFKLGEMAILVRNNSDSVPYLQALNMKGLNWRFSGSRGLYDKPEIRLCLSFMSVIADLHDSTALYDLAAGSVYEFPPVFLSQLAADARRKNRSLFYLLGHEAQIDPEIEIDEKTLAKMKELLADLEYFTRLSIDRPTGEVLYEFLMKKGILRRLAEMASPQTEQEIKNIAKFFEIIRHTSETLERNRVKEFVPYLDLLREVGDNPAEAAVDWDEDAVPVLTIHKAKGLEFPIVFMGSLVKGKFPVNERSEPLEIPRELIKEHLPEGDYHLQEERRLFYVGMTRARQELHLLSSRDMGGVRERKISPFISEALDILPQNLPYQKTPRMTLIERQAPLPFDAPPAQTEAPQQLTISYQQIDDYETCPLKYKYVHLLRIPIRLHHSIVYGSALHQTMQKFLQRWMSGRPMSEEDLLQIYQEAWKSEGFISRQHEEQRFAAGQEALKRFYHEDFPKDLPPTYVEKQFSCQIGDVKLIGRWDRVDVFPDGTATIIDYKSSEIHEQKKADERVKESAKSGQLGLYAIAYEKMNGVLPARLELRFLETGLKGCAEPNIKHLAALERKIGEVAAKIREGNFAAKPEYQACRFCAYSQICPYSEMD